MRNVGTSQGNKIKGRKSFIVRRVGMTQICLLADKEAEVKQNLISDPIFTHQM